MSFDFDTTVVGAARAAEFEGCIRPFWPGRTNSLAIGEAVGEMLAHD